MNTVSKTHSNIHRFVPPVRPKPSPTQTPETTGGQTEIQRVALVTDAWYPQVNGVVRTLDKVTKILKDSGIDVIVISPDQFWNAPCPSYPEIRLAVGSSHKVQNILKTIKPDAIHIATEGPLGLAARLWCVKTQTPFTTSYHTKFPEYSAARWGVPVDWGYQYLKWFHAPAKNVMVATPSVRRDLEDRGFQNIAPWTRGVDADLFCPGPDKRFAHLDGPIYLYVGRVAIEKNIEAFLKLDLPGSKVVIGDGPQLEELRRKYPAVHFLGKKSGADLAAHYRSADVFVFPSLTDTFGLVQLEALASGVPVAAFPVPGPIDVVGFNGPGVLNEDLKAACIQALHIPATACRSHALKYSWQACAALFKGHLHPIPSTNLCDDLSLRLKASEFLTKLVG